MLHSVRSRPDGNIPEGTPLNVGNWFYGTTVFGGSLNDGGSWKISTTGINYNWTDFSPKNIGMTSGKLMHRGNHNWGVSQNWRRRRVRHVYSTTMNGNASTCYAFNGPDGQFPWATSSTGTTRSTASRPRVARTIWESCSRSTPRAIWSGRIRSARTHTTARHPPADSVKVGNRLYGTTAYGGTYSQGTIFNIAAAGAEQTVYSFQQSGNIGTNPSGSLYYESVDSKLYGTTQSGGGTTCFISNMTGCGTIYSFKLPPQAPQLTTVYAFQGGGDGWYPLAGIMNDPNGYGLYGTTFYGGTGQAGTVWALTCPSCQ